MSHLRSRLETMFYQLAVACYHHRIKTIIFILTLFFIPAFHVGKIAFDTSTESFFHEDASAILNYNTFRNQFGRDDVIIVGIKTDDLFNIKTLNKIKAFHDDIEKNVPYIDDVTSIINVRNIRGHEDELIVEDLLEEMPKTRSEIEALKNLALSDPFYKNIILSEDGKITTIIIQLMTYTNTLNIDEEIMAFDEEEMAVSNIIDPEKAEFLSDAQVTELIEVIDSIVKKYNEPDFKIYQAGSPIVENVVKKIATREMSLFSILSILVISLFLFLTFRRISGVVFPVMIVFLSMISMLGLMAIFDTPLTMVTQILSSFILVVGVGDSVHILAVFYIRLNETEDKKEAVAQAMEHSGLAVAMTSLTTAGGLLSFTAAELKPVADLGVFGACGVGWAFLFTIFLLPAMISLCPIKPMKREKKKQDLIQRLLLKISEISIHHPVVIVSVSALLVVGSVYYITNLRFTHNILEMLPDELPAKQATKLIDRDLKGSVALEVIIDTGKENGLYDPKLLTELDQSAKEIEKMRYGDVFAGKAWSLTSILKDTHKALNEDKEEFYVVPGEKKLVSQELLLFENSGADDLEDMVDSGFRMARFTIKAPFENAMEYGPFIEMVKDHFNRKYKDVKISVTGVMALFTETMYNVMRSTTRSYVIAFIVVSVLMFIFLVNPLVAALSLFPNLIPIILILGFMGSAGIDLDSTNLIIGSIVLGLVVDDTIHFMHNFIRYYHQTRDMGSSVRNTLLTSGRAIFVTSLVLTCGFFVYMMSSMKNIVNFGMLTGLAIILALMADYFLAPALLNIFKKYLK